MNRNLVIAALAALSLFSVVGVYQRAQAASTTGNATATVISAIAINNVSDLAFGEATRGDVAKIVAAGSSENSENGSFNVTGEANKAFTITLPSTAIQITTGTNTTIDHRIAVDTFTSNPAAGANGSLNGLGAQSLFVGATRAAISANQVFGAYTGTYSVTVVY